MVCALSWQLMFAISLWVANEAFCVAQEASQCVLACGELLQDRVRRAVRQVGAVAEGDDK
jgi:hypothetical protein